MSNVMNHENIDAVGIDIKTGECILKIFDHLDWNDEHSHLVALQKK